MSGGVDSSVVAALLAEQGHEVIGITLNVWPKESEGSNGRANGCCGLSAVEDARRVSTLVGIRHYVLNFREVFAERVIADFVREYLAGRTPNPCIRCNEHIKFAAFLAKAEGLGADFIATGHYARISFDSRRGRYLLRRAADERKDQSYVLYPMKQKQLQRTLMPLGEFTKSETRRLAAAFGLPVATKPESQELCFVMDRDYAAVVAARAPEAAAPGPILDREGRVLGQHQGISHYTIGQRKGLPLAVGRPMFVAAIDPGRNAVIVGEDRDLYSDVLIAGEVNLIGCPRLESRLPVHAKVRYRMPAVDAEVSLLGHDRVVVRFAMPQRAITPGQAVVFYKGDEVLGGGTILAAGEAALAMLG
ncbi:MAG: tRNA 2-thiouridine(34) synthase MnmA [Chloroflexi bacterium]|nr:tRNA 2-thiouridine(34) synthase MnmA [Chloroflexota bacterium]